MSNNPPLWFIYSDEVSWMGGSFKEGVEAIGHQAFFRNPMQWTDFDFRPCDVAVVFGWRENSRDCIYSQVKRNIPTIVVDLGYVSRFEDDNRQPDASLQVGLGDTLNNIVSFECPTDRMQKLGLRYPGTSHTPKGYALFCGQLPKDAAHPFQSDLAVKEFLEEIRARIPKVEVKFRQHPRAATDKVSRRCLEEDMAGARCIITYNSNTGHDALREGMPVFCHKSAHYAELATPLEQLEKKIARPPFPSKEKWEAYFSRLAYSQWSFAEMAAGLPQTFIWDQLQGVIPPIVRSNDDQAMVA